MLCPRMGSFSPVEIEPNAAFVIILVCGAHGQSTSRWDDSSILQLFRERLPAQHTEPNIKVYRCEDLDMQASPSVTIDKAAKRLLSELDGSKRSHRTLSFNNPSETEDLSSLDPGLPLLFICSGIAGMVVKRALVLAKSHSITRSFSQRVTRIIFLDTPHTDDVQVWADRIRTTTELRHRNGRSWRTKHTLEYAENFVEITKDFQQLSSLYVIIYFCNEDWLECSGATVLHSDCLWSLVSHDYVQRADRENHYILPRSMTAVRSMGYLEHAVVGIQKAASRKSDLKCLESLRCTKDLHVQERLASTCTWILTDNKYRDWLATDGPACLWLSGDPGTGKSILSTFIIDHLLTLRHQVDVVVYCFLEEGLGRYDFAKHILEVLFRQLQENDAVPNFMQYSILPEIGNVDSPFHKEVFQRLLRKLLETISIQTRTVLVLDGVDKDEWINCVVIDEVTHINSLRHRSNLMRCLISSRESCDYNKHHGQTGNISLDNELGVQRDVLQFAEAQLANIYPAVGNAKLHLTSIAKRICRQGRGNFLWVALVIENLEGAISIDKVEKEVETLPSTIDGLYQLLLQNVPSQEMERVQRLFAWLIAANRPLKLPELAEALATQPDPHRPLGDDVGPSQIWICCHLTTTNKDNSVRFRHPSVRSHLLSADEAGIWRTSVVEAHTFLAQTCLMLLTPEEDKHSPLPQDIGCTSSIKSYAFNNWSFHYGMAEPHSMILVGALHRSLTISMQHDCEDISLPAPARLGQIRATILRIAAHYGFASLTRVSLEMGVDQNGSCDSCETPLALAAARGHSKVVELLIQRRASTAACNLKCGETALHLAAANGSQETVKVLLKGGAKADSSANYLNRTPLHAAASSGNLDIVKMLMDFHVELNVIAPKSGETPLHLAASRGHLQTVKWLIEGLSASDDELHIYESLVRQRDYQAWTENLLTDSASIRRLSRGADAKSSAEENMSELQSLCGRYADINMRTREGRTALHLAASNGHVPIARFLLQTGADINLVDNSQNTALRLAAENGHLKVVKLLLTAGAELDSNQLGATLKSITKNGHDAIANLLAWHSFSVEMTGKPCLWPVLALATKSKQNTVRDAITKSRSRSHSRARRAQYGTPSQDRKMGSRDYCPSD